MGTPLTFTWAGALNSASELKFAGHADWRLPNIKELQSIIEDHCTAPALNADVFPIDQGFVVWSATPAHTFLENIFDDAWTMDDAGAMWRHSKDRSDLVLLLVRSP